MKASDMNVMIDTEIWSFSLKAPMREKFGSEEEYKKVLEAHAKAATTIKNTLLNDTVYMSLHQVSELYHVLSYRGSRLSPQAVRNYLENIMDSDEIVKVEVTKKDLMEAMQLSQQSEIHIWDFLCFVPVKKYIDAVYTVDKHFTHDVFKKFNIKIMNPLDFWTQI
ncbi:MAG: PIN domain-containing protein [Candidatus Jordarchaeaceae archaeon]